MNVFHPYILLILLPLLILSESARGQKIELGPHLSMTTSFGINLYVLKSDSLFSENQQVSVAELQTDHPSKCKLAIAYSDTLLKKTTLFAEESHALVALNGGFFDVEKGGSVAYLEAEGKVVARTRSPREKWAKSDSLLNGAIVLNNSGSLKIEIAQPDAFYEKSEKERMVMIAGPMLLLDGMKVQLENSAFVRNRHPRSCLCETNSKNILLIAIDGRSEAASGMNLKEVQQLLLRLGCRDAINLDGGGSTTLWINNGVDKSIVNHPSDKTGERPVANVLLILP